MMTITRKDESTASLIVRARPNHTTASDPQEKLVSDAPGTAAYRELGLPQPVVKPAIIVNDVSKRFTVN
jgi:hypothetical protein